MGDLGFVAWEKSIDPSWKEEVTSTPTAHIHNYISVVTAPNCTDSGYTAYICGCGNSYIADKVPALGHTDAEPVGENGKAATCSEAGSYDSVVYCTVCKVEVSRKSVSVATIAHVDETGDHKCDVCDKADVTTCADKDKNHKCDDCNATLSSCTDKTGDGDHSCDVCGSEKITNCDANVEIPAVEATCTETGKTAGTKCSECGTVQTAQAAVDALGHKYEVVVIAPTCTVGGYTNNICFACGDSYKSNETAEMGHTEVYDAAVAPTCTAIGLTEGFHCCTCGEVLVAQEVVPKTSHTDAGGDGKCDACGDNMVVIVWGDVDGNGRVNTNDAKLVLQYALKIIDATELNCNVSDVDGNGRINTNDAKLVLQFALRIISQFPVEQ